MAISNDRLVRILLLVVCIGLWAVAFPAFARGIVGPAVTRDLVTAGSLSVAVVFHTLSVILLGSICEHSRHPWSYEP